MQKNDIIITGDTPGLEYRLPVVRFAGKGQGAPSAYLQAALHAEELPGVAALHFLVPMLNEAEAHGAVLGDITIVPQANPIGTAQRHFGAMQGRFDLGSRVNFNRDYPALEGKQGRDGLLDGIEKRPATEQLKYHLLHMATGADLMLDLHCDDESLLYAYIGDAFWPAAMDLAESCGLEAVLLSDGKSSAFEDAVSQAWQGRGDRKDWANGRLSITMEYRGIGDVEPAKARSDAEGLYAFLQRRGVLAGQPIRKQPFTGPVAGLDYVQMVDAPVAGTVLYERNIGDTVKAGDRLATLITRPGDRKSDIVVKAPTDGTIITRIRERFVRRGDNLMKIASRERSNAARKPGGALEE